MLIKKKIKPLKILPQICVYQCCLNIYLLSKNKQTKQNYEVTNMYLITFPNVTEKNQLHFKKMEFHAINKMQYKRTVNA